MGRHIWRSPDIAARCSVPAYPGVIRERLLPARVDQLVREYLAGSSMNQHACEHAFEKGTLVRLITD
jgi:hypothetical protein